MRKFPDLRYLFEPRSVAVIGASRNPEKIGYRILSNIIHGGYGGEVYPVNVKGGEILGKKVYRSIEEIDNEIDLSIIAIPAPYVYDAVKSCASANVKFIIIITSGFSEIGNRKEEEKIVEFARSHGMRILGPNVFGLYSANASLNASFGPSDIMPGKIAIISQSGALGGAMIGKSAADGIGLSAIVSVGNKADLDEADLLEYFRKDKRTRVVLMYIEGVKNGEKLIKSLKAMPKDKHVVVIKSGRSKRGALAAASHTGSLAGSDEVFDGVADQCRILRAESIEEAFNWCRVLANSPIPKGDNSVIITNGGGFGVMCADACEKYNVPLLGDTNLLKKIFKDVIPEFGSFKNPIDLTGQAGPKEYMLSLEKALKTRDIDSVLALYCETGIFDSSFIRDVIVKITEEYRGKKPILFSTLGGEDMGKIVADLRKKGILIFDDVYDAASGMGALYRRKMYIEEMEHEEPAPPIEFDAEAIREIISSALKEGRTLLLANEAKKLMELVGIPVPEWRVARNLDEAIRFSEEIGYPVVLKVVSEDIVHKTDAGGVALNIEDREEVIDAYQAIMRNCKSRFPRARIRGVEVCKMVPKGIETITGCTTDRSFGPVVMFGLGGIYVEILKDVSFRAVPITLTDAKKMVRSIKSYPLLLGARGEKKRDIPAIIDTLLKLSKLMETVREISDIEINPLMVYEHGSGVMAVDVRVILGRRESP